MDQDLVMKLINLFTMIKTKKSFPELIKYNHDFVKKKKGSQQKYLNPWKY